MSADTEHRDTLDYHRSDLRSTLGGCCSVCASGQPVNRNQLCVFVGEPPVGLRAKDAAISRSKTCAQSAAVAALTEELDLLGSPLIRDDENDRPAMVASDHRADFETNGTSPTNALPTGRGDAGEFRLSREFVHPYAVGPSPFTTNGLGEFVYKRTYSRKNPDTGKKEAWYETVERVVNGTMNMNKRHHKECGIAWDEAAMTEVAHDLYERIFTMKFLPPGRGLWAMGTAIIEEKRLHAALNNCAFVSTDGMQGNPSRPFEFLMDGSMLGVGIGFDTAGAGCMIIPGALSMETNRYVIPDTREGWVASVRLQLEAHFRGLPRMVFDYSEVRASGLPLRTFGGTSSGPGPLRDLHTHIDELMFAHVGRLVTSTLITDLMNRIGQCVVAGNVRRTAEIAFGNAGDDEFLHLKDYERNPHRAAFGWTSNNSIFADIGMDYSNACQLARINGEPGFAWLQNMQEFHRMDGTRTMGDMKARGTNPCGEQTLESFETCCLVDVYPVAHLTLDDFLCTVRAAFFYAKTVTLGRTHWTETQKVMSRNRRIGTSMSGIAEFVAQRGLDEMRVWCERGYEEIRRFDALISAEWQIPESIKITSIKPSGTTSLLTPYSPGIHHPFGQFYERRVRLSSDSDLIAPLRAAGYPLEQAVDDPRALIVTFPMKSATGCRTRKDVSMWEQLELAAFIQRYWSDNQVSCTVTFNPESEGAQLESALDVFQHKLKSISFLPHNEASFPQMPYTEITEQKYEQLVAPLSPIDWSLVDLSDSHAERFCNGDQCPL